MRFNAWLDGADAKKHRLRVVGWKPIAQAILLWLAVSVGLLLVILHTTA